jgi:hypothetical protein
MSQYGIALLQMIIDELGGLNENTMTGDIRTIAFHRSRQDL